MDGVLVIDKPEGITSHDVVSVARRALRERRVGHTGTLDPLATGVLPLACGRATRLVRFLSASDKQYEAGIRFGVTTDTYDVTGQELSRVPARVPADALAIALESLRGRYMQAPPPYSAKRVGGRRAYELARRDEPVVLEPAPVHVRDLRLLDRDDDRCSVTLTCSAGFYVRSFAHDLGQRLGTGACLETLRRTRSGEFSLERAVTMDELVSEDEPAAAWVLPLETLLPAFPAVRLNEEGRLRVTHGRVVEPTHYVPGPGRVPAQGRDAPALATDEAVAPAETSEWIRMLDPDGRLVALARPGPTPGSLHPQVVLT
jgi:tRNA pseudouridine55 synthase